MESTLRLSKGERHPTLLMAQMSGIYGNNSWAWRREGARGSKILSGVLLFLSLFPFDSRTTTKRQSASHGRVWIHTDGVHIRASSHPSHEPSSMIIVILDPVDELLLGYRDTRGSLLGDVRCLSRSPRGELCRLNNEGCRFEFRNHT